MIVILPAGVEKALVCDDCKGTSFQLASESRDDKIDAFHTLCTGCGKRGMLSHRVATTTTSEFVQFGEMPDGVVVMPRPKGSVEETGE